MADMYIKPGNQERGWNDPPQFSYGLQTAQGSGPKRVLNKRVPPPQLSGPQSPSPGVPPPLSGTTPPANPGAPPSCGMTPPPPPSGMTSSKTPPPPPSSLNSLMTQPPRLSQTAQTDLPSTDSEAEPSIDEVVALLQWALTACRTSVKKQVCEDVDKRLKVFEDMWKSGKLSLPVKKRMNLLVQEMKSHNWDAADDIHRSLMVDHVNEVSQWMVGVKRLIAETRNLQPEYLCTTDAELPQSGKAEDPKSESSEMLE